MEKVLRNALLKYNGLRQQLDNVLLGEEGDVWEAQLKNFLAKRPCWVNGKQNTSEKFDPATFVVSTTPTQKTYTIGTDRKKLISTKEEGGLFDWVDPDIAKWFPDVIFTDTEPVSGKVQLFKNNIKHRDIIAEGENLGIYEEYELGAGLLLANELVKAGAIEKRGYGVIICLKNRKNDTRCRLDVYRRGDGRLHVRVNGVNPGNEWGAGDGVLFIN